MRQWNQIEREPFLPHAKLFTDDRLKPVGWQELRDGKLAHREHQVRPQDFKFPIPPWQTLVHFVAGWHPIAAGGFLSGKATACGGHVDRFANLHLTESSRIVEPAKERLAGGPGERPSEQWLLVARRLANQHHFAYDRPAADHGLMHVGTTTAGAQSRDVVSQQPYSM